MVLVRSLPTTQSEGLISVMKLKAAMTKQYAHLSQYFIDMLCSLWFKPTDSLGSPGAIHRFFFPSTGFTVRVRLPMGGGFRISGCQRRWQWRGVAWEAGGSTPCPCRRSKSHFRQLLSGLVWGVAGGGEACAKRADVTVCGRPLRALRKQLHAAPELCGAVRGQCPGGQLQRERDPSGAAVRPARQPVGEWRRRQQWQRQRQW